jgi:hypothetical protein
MRLTNSGVVLSGAWYKNFNLGTASLFIAVSTSFEIAMTR